MGILLAFLSYLIFGYLLHQPVLTGVAVIAALLYGFTRPRQGF